MLDDEIFNETDKYSYNAESYRKAQDSIDRDRQLRDELDKERAEALLLALIITIAIAGTTVAALFI